MNREGSRDIARLVDYREGYQPGARRFDVGEASNFILTPIAAAALRQVLDWKPLSIAGALVELTGRIAEWAEESGFKTAPPRFRSPHMIGLQKTGGLPKDLTSKLAEQRVFVSLRGETIRISPHLYNNLNDLERLFSALNAFH